MVIKRDMRKYKKHWWQFWRPKWYGPPTLVVQQFKQKKKARHRIVSCVFLCFAMFIIGTMGVKSFIDDIKRGPFEIVIEEISSWEYRKRQENDIEATPREEPPEPTYEEHDEEWVRKNLYKVEESKNIGGGVYRIKLVNIQEPNVDETWDTLKARFFSTSYKDENSYYIDEGVNCRGMVNYLAKWCILNRHSFAVEYSDDHVDILIQHREIWYCFDFTKNPQIYELTYDPMQN